MNDRPTFDRDAWRTASKQHSCCECRGAIVKGERYYLLVGVWDGEFSSFRYHRICREISRAQVDALHAAGVLSDDYPAIGDMIETAIEDATAAEDFPAYWPPGVYVGAVALRKHVAEQRTRELHHALGIRPET